MSDLNSLSITGRLTKDAVKRTFPSGKPYVTFDIANNTGFGEYASVNYFKCIILDKRADTLGQYLVKGKQVALQGTLEKNDWTNQEGKVVHDWQLKVNDVVLISDGKAHQPDKDLPFASNDDDLKKQAQERYNSAGTKRKKKPEAEDAEVIF